MEGGNLRNALQELQQIIITPIKAFSAPCPGQTAPDSSASQESAPSSSEVTKAVADKEPASEGFQPQNPPPCDGDSSATPISEEDIAGQFTRVMGKGDMFNFHCMIFITVKLTYIKQNQVINDVTSYRCVTLQD